MMNIILCGLPGVGKTTVGKLLAERLSYTFIDTDEEIVKLYGKNHRKFSTCREIARKNGMVEFRHIEEEAVLSLKYKQNCLIATGGGVMERPTNLYVLQYIGKIIYLRGRPESIFKRVTRSGIPPYLDAKDSVRSFMQLVEKRSPLLEQTYSWAIDTDALSPDEIAEKAFKLCKMHTLLL